MYPQGTKIRFANGKIYHGTGKICGVATTGAPVIGKSMIVELETLFDSENKPIAQEYTHITVFEVEIKEILK